ncbi:MAG: pitrilysin family protein [Pseudomonadota bacterium]
MKLLTQSFRWSAAAAVCLTILAFAGIRPAHAVEIQEVKSPGGITAWLVEDRSIPLMTMRFTFLGGWALDPAGKEGITNLMAGMLDEGAADRKSKAFQKLQQQLAMRMSFRARADRFYGTFQTLTHNREQSVDLLADAVNRPRFDQVPLERIRGQVILNIKSNLQDPDNIARKAWHETMFGEHPYARTRRGPADTVAKLSSEDLHSLRDRLFRKDGLIVAVVGDIDAKSLASLLDEVFGGLPQSTDMPKLQEASAARDAGVQVIDKNVPQSVIVFGHSGIKRDDDDFIPAYVLNFILGGGGFGSRLTEEIREKRGLTYSVYSYLSPYDHGALFIGGASTQNARAGETVKIIKQEIARMATEGPTQKELDDAKTYMTGSYALRFDTSSKIAGQLQAIQVDDLGIDYIVKRNEKINAVTLDDLKRVAKRLLKPDELVFTIVGKPQGVDATHSTGG